jgi:hypothetical protein
MRHLAYAPDEQGRQAEQAITLALLRAKDGTRLPYARLCEQLADLDAQAFDGALLRLFIREVLSIERNVIQAINSHEQRRKLDLLAAVVLHILVTARKVLPVVKIAEECERDYANADERAEVELALGWLAEDKLVSQQDDGWLATRPAVRATELSF